MNGFVNQLPEPQYTVSKTIIGEDGRVQTVLVDPTTGSQLSQPSGYDMIAAGNYWNPNPPEPEQSTAEEIIKPQEDPRMGSGRDTTQSSKAGEFNRSVTDNYGYIDKPGWLSATGFLPGPAGMVGKMVNMGVNANNVKAVNDARDTIDLPSLGFMDTVKGVMRDRKGQVAPVTINNQDYEVGLEALSPAGQTNLTPNEARQRAAWAGGLTETPKEQAIQNRKEFAKSDLGKQNQGFIQKTYNEVKEVAKNFVDSIFGGSDKSNSPGKNSFPDRPSSPDAPDNSRYDGSSYSGNNKGLDSPSEGRGQSDNGSYSGAGLY